MSRKIKPNKLFDDVQKVDAEEIIDKNEAIKVSEVEMLGIDENSIVGNGRMSSEDASKIAKYDAMEKSLAALSQEKEILETKIVSYVNKIDELKDASTKIISLEEENKDLKEKCNKYEKNEIKIEKLKREIKSLKEENDNYLMKISELTFENANLTCQLSELEKSIKSNGNVANQNKFMPSGRIQHQMQSGLAHPNKDAYNPYVNNGYGSW